MKVIIQPSIISGTITAPASKSSMQRACAAALIRKGESFIHNPGISNDDLAAISIIKNLGATTEYSNEILLDDVKIKQATGFNAGFIEKNIRPAFITTFHGAYSVNKYSSIMAKGDMVIVVSKTIEK